ncbi:MAG: hypothetical protein JWN31_1670 [Frankiales bacterium]|nr:hypothetical protein [Frankiales bacterium]
MREPVRRVFTVGLTSVVLFLLTAGPALADDPTGRKEGADPGPPVSTLHIVLVYVLLPITIAALIAAVVWLPGAMRANRYRPNRPWTATPVWFAGPPEPLKAVESAEVGDMVRGGARGDW